MSRRLIGFICLIILTTLASGDSNASIYYKFSSKSTPETLQAVSNGSSEDGKGISNDDEEYGDEYDYGYGDEYEDELRAIATSAEETSKTKTNTPSKSSAFDMQHTYEKPSMEKSVPSNSTNNNLIYNNGKEKEVTELKSYINQRSKALKTKRIPTVKKELSSQKEILSVSNETQVPKSLISNENNSNRLGEDARNLQNTNIPNNNELSKMKQTTDELHAGHLTIRSDATAFSNNFIDIDEQSDVTKKINKRRNAVLKDLQDYLLEEYTEKRKEQILKNIEEAAVTKNLLKLLTELAEDPERWLRVNRFLVALDNELSPVYSSQKRTDVSQNFDSDQTFEETFTKLTKSPQRKNRRRKLRKHKPSTTTTTAAYTTMSSLMIPETNKDTDNLEPVETDWLNRLKVWQNNYPKSTTEQLFEARWPYQMKDNENTYLKSNNRDPPQQKEHRNSRRPPSESERVIVNPPDLQPRLLHYGKVYDHQSENADDQTIVYDRGVPMMNNYEALEKTYDPYRYHNLGRAYDDYERLLAKVDYPVLPKYNWPWNFPSSRAPFNKWSWQPLHTDHPKTWNYWNKSWQNNRDYWSELNDRENDNTNTYPENGRIKAKQKSWDHERTIQKNKNKNRSELKSSSGKEQIDNNELPKISMKTWTSLTSDPATWPFKLPGVKPWPKDENGHTYNPNADLVRKLGLDQEEEDAKIDENKKNHSDAKMSQSNPVNMQTDEDTRTWSGIMNSERKSWSQKNTWKPVNSFEEDLTSQRDRSSMTWPARVSNADHIWSSKTDRDNPWSSSKLHDEWNFGKPSQTSSTWPNKWKQFAYHRVTAFPMSKSGPTLEGSAKPKNAYIAVSAVSAPKYTGNEWKKNEIEDLGITPMKSVDHLSEQIKTREQPIYAWKKNGLTNNTKARQDKEPSDPLEHQLKDLRLHELDNSTKVVRKTTTAPVSQTSTSASNEPSAARENKNSSAERDKLSTHLKVQHSSENENAKEDFVEREARLNTGK